MEEAKDLFETMCDKIVERVTKKLENKIDDLVKEHLRSQVLQTINEVIEYPISIEEAAEYLGEKRDTLYKRNKIGIMNFEKNKRRLFTSIKRITEDLLGGGPTD